MKSNKPAVLDARDFKSLGGRDTISWPRNLRRSDCHNTSFQCSNNAEVSAYYVKQDEAVPAMMTCEPHSRSPEGKVYFNCDLKSARMEVQKFKFNKSSNSRRSLVSGRKPPIAESKSERSSLSDAKASPYD
jgi:hypothetical protein